MMDSTSTSHPRAIVRWRRRLLWLCAVALLGAGVYAFTDRMGPRNWAVSAISFSPDGQKLVVGTYRWRRAPPSVPSRFRIAGVAQSVKSLEPSTGAPIGEIERTYFNRIQIGAPEPSSWVAFSPEGKEMVIGHFDGRMVLRDSDAWIKSRVIGDETHTVNNVTFIRDGKALCVGHRFLPVIYDLNDPSKWTQLDVDARPYCTAVSPDGKLLAFASGLSDVAIVDSASLKVLYRYSWNAETGKLANPRDVNLFQCRRVAFAPNGEQLAVSLQGNREELEVKLVDVQTGEEVHRIPGRSGTIRFSPDQRTFAIGGHLGLSLIDTDTFQERYFQSRPCILDMAFSPDSRSLVLGDWDGWAESRETATGKVLWRTYVGRF